MDSIKVVDNAIVEMMQTEIILADKSIKKVLVALSKSSDYTRTLKECAKGFDFDREFKRYFEPKSNAPQGRALVALIVGMLYKIDAGKLNFLDFLKFTYIDVDTTKSYRLFISEYIIPFVDTLNMLTFGQPYEEVSTPQINSYDKLKEEITWAINGIIKEQLNVDDMEINEEVIAMLNGLCYSISFGDNIIIKTAFIGLKNTLVKYGINLNDRLDNIHTILTVYGVM
ncbi:MAG: hypothetical protein GX242_01290 [Clostridiales bacterium]|nr:hypothetical protein [Clostridiales bacterium]